MLARDPGAASGRYAVGAIARLRLSDRTLTRHVETGTGEGNQNDPRLHFGLGEHKAPVTVEIIWPGGRKTVTKELAVNQQHTVGFEAK